MSMRHVYFIGTFSYGLEREQQKVLEIPADAEVWVVNEAHYGLPEGRKADRVFQLHVRNWREPDRAFLYSNGKRLPPSMNRNCFGRNKAHVDYLRTCGVPVYGQRVWDDIPTSTQYPFDEVTEAVGIPLPPEGAKRLWATSSFGYMAALLLTEHLIAKASPQGKNDDGFVKELSLYGVELPIGSQRERLWEWPNLAYYLGMMRGLGIRINLPPVGSALLSAPHYALDARPAPLDADHWLFPGEAAIIDDGETYRLGTVGQNVLPTTYKVVAK